MLEESILRQFRASVLRDISHYRTIGDHFERQERKLESEVVTCWLVTARLMRVGFFLAFQSHSQDRSTSDYGNRSCHCYGSTRYNP
jgi:hypothetical protein